MSSYQIIKRAGVCLFHALESLQEILWVKSGKLATVRPRLYGYPSTWTVEMGAAKRRVTTVDHVRKYEMNWTHPWSPCQARQGYDTLPPTWEPSHQLEVGRLLLCYMAEVCSLKTTEQKHCDTSQKVWRDDRVASKSNVLNRRAEAIRDWAIHIAGCGCSSGM